MEALYANFKDLTRILKGIEDRIMCRESHS